MVSDHWFGLLLRSCVRSINATVSINRHSVLFFIVVVVVILIFLKHVYLFYCGRAVSVSSMNINVVSKF